ncbi:MAG: hypothetical protein LUC30_10575 [Clostridiales bacterium]|nr:hypothetical protein [Clostridiales bacterium]
MKVGLFAYLSALRKNDKVNSLLTTAIVSKDETVAVLFSRFYFSNWIYSSLYLFQQDMSMNLPSQTGQNQHMCIVKLYAGGDWHGKI